MTAREAGGDLALIQTSLFFSCKCKLVSIRTTWFTQQKQGAGLYQNKVTSSLTAIQSQVTEQTTIKWLVNTMYIMIISLSKIKALRKNKK